MTLPKTTAMGAMTNAQMRTARNNARAIKMAKMANQLPPTWSVSMDNPSQLAPYGVRWGRTTKGGTTHIMEWNKYMDKMVTRCSSSGRALVHNANVYINGKQCVMCTKYMFHKNVNNNISTASKADWKYYTDPLTGRTKRERHN